jgi:hypothetical protein
MAVGLPYEIVDYGPKCQRLNAKGRMTKSISGNSHFKVNELFIVSIIFITSDSFAML